MSNLLAHGADFSNSAWQRVSGVEVNPDSWPDPLGGMRADQLKKTEANNGETWQEVDWFAPNTTYTAAIQVWARPADNATIRLFFNPEPGVPGSQLFGNYEGQYADPAGWNLEFWTFTTPASMDPTQEIGFQLNQGADPTLEYPVFGMQVLELADPGANGEHIPTFVFNDVLVATAITNRLAAIAATITAENGYVTNVGATPKIGNQPGMADMAPAIFIVPGPQRSKPAYARVVQVSRDVVIKAVVNLDQHPGVNEPELVDQVIWDVRKAFETYDEDLMQLAGGIIHQSDTPGYSENGGNAVGAAVTYSVTYQVSLDDPNVAI